MHQILGRAAGHHLAPVHAGAGANILTVQHDKLRAGLNPNETTVRFACEVGGEEHGLAVLEAVRGQGYALEAEQN